MNRLMTAVPRQSSACRQLIGAAVVPGGEWRGGRGEPEKTRRELLERHFNGKRWKVDKKEKKQGMWMDMERMHG